MAKRHINAAYAKVDAAHLFDGLFVPTSGRPRGRLLIEPREVNGAMISFQGFEQLGADDQSLFLALSAQLGIRSELNEPDSLGPVSQQLRESLYMQGDNSGTLLTRCTSLRSLARDAGYHPDSSTNNVPISLNRMANVQMRVKSKTGADYRSNLISTCFNVETGTLCIAANPRLSRAIIGDDQYIKVSMVERNRLHSEVSKILHAFLSNYTKPGKTFGFKNGVLIETLAVHVYGDAWSSFSLSSQCKKRALVRQALKEIHAVTNWTIECPHKDLASIRRPSTLPATIATGVNQLSARSQLI